MKKDRHPKYLDTSVHCNGCNTEFKTRSTVSEITVEICSQCHPFYTGKQKLVDVAGRVDRFKAQQAAAVSRKQTKKNKDTAKTANKPNSDTKLKALKKELETHTIDTKQ